MICQCPRALHNEILTNRIIRSRIKEVKISYLGESKSVMEEINIHELYSYFCSAMSHCGTFLLNSNDGDVGYHIFEEFDADCISFLSDLALNSLLSAQYISKEIYDLSSNLAKLFRSLEGTNLWNIESVRNSKEWLRILSLADEINKIINVS